MAEAIAQGRNPMLDMIEAASKGFPLVFGSKQYTTQEGSVDPYEMARSRSLVDSLVARSSSTAQADQIVQDILYRAQLAFAPVLGEEKQAGMYNTTVRSQLARESVARATAASAQAVLQDQQQAMQAATQLQAANTKAASGSKTTQATPGRGKQMLGSLLTAQAVSQGKKVLSKTLEDSASKDTSEILGDEYTSGLEDYIASDGGAMQALGMADEQGGNFAASGFTGGDAPSMVVDDVEALQQLINSTVIPGISDGTQVADSGQTQTDAGVEGIDLSNSGFSPELIQQGLNSGLSMQTMQTIGPIATQKAIEASTAGLADTAGAVDTTVTGVETVTTTAEGAETVSTGSDIVFGTSAEIANEAAINAGTEYGANVAAEGIADLYFPGLYTVANYVSDGMLGEAVGEIGAQGREFAVGEEDGSIIQTAKDISGAVEDPLASAFDVSIMGHDTEEIFASGLDTVDYPVQGFEALFEDSIICGELFRQGKLRKRWYILGLKEFRTYDQRGKQGYYIWSRYIVAHLRTNPTSTLSKMVQSLFNQRAEYIAAKQGDRTAKATFLGKILERGMYATCWLLSRTLARNFRYG